MSQDEYTASRLAALGVQGGEVCPASDNQGSDELQRAEYAGQ